ncbi:hypothetical protein EJ02DRAFT_215225 [Clathrospora elynae]|uniref:Uncharacterized protein n=1 Tax=Clathrospora elynae TaxID=706981 RepID=A0A6A5T767_9PLEO|nr:hypothetical protein EJ02DRAFT_215225 [Clathrospora elynae]
MAQSWAFHRILVIVGGFGPWSDGCEVGGALAIYKVSSCSQEIGKKKKRRRVLSRTYPHIFRIACSRGSEPMST